MRTTRLVLDVSGIYGMEGRYPARLLAEGAGVVEYNECQNHHKKGKVGKNKRKKHKRFERL